MISTGTLSNIRQLPGKVVGTLQQEDELPRVPIRQIVLGTAGLAIVFGAIGIFLNAAIATLLIVIGLATWLWRAPARGLYLMAACCALVQTGDLNFADSLTDRIPLWINLDSSGSGIPIGLSPFDVILGTVIVIAALRGLFAGRLRLSAGRLNAPYYIYGGVLIFGLLNGLMTGGKLNMAEWALRPQFYGLLVFVVTTALLRERRQLVVLLIVFLTAEMITAILGDWRYLVTLQRNISSVNSLLAHEDSYFLLLFLVALGVILVWARRAGTRLLLLLAPVVILALIENNRRTGIDAAGISFILFMALVIRYRPDMRKYTIPIGATLAAAYGAFVAASWNVQYGTRSELVSPVKSALGQDTGLRNSSSDAYRIAENFNLVFTFHLSPITGWGLGKDFLQVAPMVNLGNSYSLYLLLPHNSLLWVPMALGAVGMIAFWALVGTGLMESINAIRIPNDRLLQAVGVFCACGIVAELVFAYADLQLMNPRNMVTFGILLGIANVAPRLAARRRGAALPEEVRDEP